MIVARNARRHNFLCRKCVEILLYLFDALRDGALEPRSSFDGIVDVSGALREIAAEHHLGIGVTPTRFPLSTRRNPSELLTAKRRRIEAILAETGDKQLL